MTPIDKEHLAVAGAFTSAFNRHDLDAVMACMTEDCTFMSPAGTDRDGTQHIGAPAVRRAIAAVFSAYPDAHWSPIRELAANNSVVTEWTFSGTAHDGSRTEVNGCDILTFMNGKIAVKNAFRKQRLTS